MTELSKATGDLSQRFSLDVQGFDALRAEAAASPQQAAKKVAGQFDAMFLQMMMKSMRDATQSGGIFGSSEEKTYTSMLDQQLAEQMSSKGIGVADALMSQLMRNANLPADSAKAGGFAAMNAMAKAYQNASMHNDAFAGARDYTAASALTPPLKGNSGTPEIDSFVDKMAGAAQAASDATGIPARFIVGQAALESGWGKREIRGAHGEASHNVFGIKATKDWKGKTVAAVTTEYTNGRPHRVVAHFRAYGSYEEAMTDYANLLKNNPRYASVINSGQSAERFAQGMQRAGYATDPHYAKKLISIMQEIG